MAARTFELFAPGTIGLHGIDLSRVSIWKHGDEWRVWIPPTGPESYDTDGESYLGPFGDTFWPTFDEAVDFVRQYLNGYWRDAT